MKCKENGMSDQLPDMSQVVRHEDVRAWLDHFATFDDEWGYDDEAAHAHEKELWTRVLQAIADGRCASPQHIAALALLSLEVDFQRWLA